jgi:hypothetical protein
MFTFRLTVVVTRPSTDVTFWVYSGLPTDAYWHYCDPFLADGSMSPTTFVYSADLLTATKTIDFIDGPTFETITNGYATTFPTLFAERNTYETSTSQVRTMTWGKIPV